MKNYKIFLIPGIIITVSFIFITLCIFNLTLNKKINKAQANVYRLEYNLSQLQKNWWQNTEATNAQLKSATLQLQQKFNELTNTLGQPEATEPGYQLRAILRLATLAAMQLTLNKEEPLAKELLNQAVNKLIKLNDPRLNPILYNLQDEYNYLLNENDNNITNVFQKINAIQLLLDQLQTTSYNNINNNIEISDIFSDNNKTSYFKIEILNIYLEQAKIAFAQNNTFLYKQAINAVEKTLKLVLWEPDTILAIQQHLSWLANVEIKNYSLLLQAILNLEDLL